jgi:bacterioferritin-associated ferredoxin
MIVCLCRGVSDRKVRLAVLEGAGTLKEVATRCGAGRGCGACHEQIRQLIQSHRAHAAGSPPAANGAELFSAECPAGCPTSSDTILSGNSIGEGSG